MHPSAHRGAEPAGRSIRYGRFRSWTPGRCGVHSVAERSGSGSDSVTRSRWSPRITVSSNTMVASLCSRTSRTRSNHPSRSNARAFSGSPSSTFPAPNSRCSPVASRHQRGVVVARLHVWYVSPGTDHVERVAPSMPRCEPSPLQDAVLHPEAGDLRQVPDPEGRHTAHGEGWARGSVFDTRVGRVCRLLGDPRGMWRFVP